MQNSSAGREIYATHVEISAPHIKCTAIKHTEFKYTYREVCGLGQSLYLWHITSAIITSETHFNLYALLAKDKATTHCLKVDVNVSVTTSVGR